MKKLLPAVAMIVALLALAKRFAPKMRDVDWEKRFERMPDNAPRKWMFRSISAIRDNTDRILERLERNESLAAGASMPPAHKD